MPIERLIEAFEQEERLSVGQIMEILHCTRKTVYNYLKYLETNGYTLEREKCGRQTYYSIHMEQDKPVLNPAYPPITQKILKKYRIIQPLQYGALRRQDLRKKFALEDGDDGELPLDISQRYFFDLLKELEFEGEVRYDASKEVYSLTGGKIPIQMNLDYDSVLSLNILLANAAQGTPYSELLQNLFFKTNLLLGIIDKEMPYYDNYITYGKNMEGLSDAVKKLKEIEAFDFRHRILQISYDAKDGDPEHCFLALGMIVYCVEKDGLYLAGKRYLPEQKRFSSRYTVIEAGQVTGVKETEWEHDLYHAGIFEVIFQSMLSISTEEPVNVKVAFDRYGNVERKIRYLGLQRKNSADVQVEGGRMIYSDTVRGMGELKNYLRKFGRSAHVMEPDFLKNEMRESVRCTLERYKEAEDNGLS